MIERISIEHDICEADGQQVWFIYADGVLYTVCNFRAEVLKAVAELLRKEIEK